MNARGVEGESEPDVRRGTHADERGWEERGDVNQTQKVRKKKSRKQKANNKKQTANTHVVVKP